MYSNNIIMAKFELIEENNDILVEQVSKLFDSSHKEIREWATQNAHVIMELDQETAEKVNNCANSFDYLKLLTGEEVEDPKNRIIGEFLNKRSTKYRTAARARRRAKQTIESAEGAEA